MVTWEKKSRDNFAEKKSQRSVNAYPSAPDINWSLPYNCLYIWHKAKLCISCYTHTDCNTHSFRLSLSLGIHLSTILIHHNTEANLLTANAENLKTMKIESTVCSCHSVGDLTLLHTADTMQMVANSVPAAACSNICCDAWWKCP